jgi:beta-glucosidase
MEQIKQPLDRIGFNVYSGSYVRAADNAEGFESIPHVDGQPRMNIPWLQIMPEAIYWVPRLAKEALGFQGETLITENGAAAVDYLTPRKEVLDTDRVMYLKQYFRQLHRLVADGYPMKGYFLWSFMDNFEWSWGYAKRFGIIFTNYETQERIPKASAKWYAEVIKHNRVV